MKKIFLLGCGFVFCAGLVQAADGSSAVFSDNTAGFPLPPGTVVSVSLDVEDGAGNDVDLRLEGTSDLIVNGVSTKGLDVKIDTNIGKIAQNETDIAAAVTAGNNLAGVGRTTETIKGNADAITAEAGTRGNEDLLIRGEFATADAVLQTQVNNNRTDINRNRASIDRNSAQISQNRRGIAMTAALTHTTVLPGMNNALDVSAAVFDGEVGIAMSYSRRLTENVQVDIAAATTSDLEESVIRAGIGVQW